MSLPASTVTQSILVVDDDEFLSQLFCQFLQSKGFAARATYSLHGALEIIKADADVDLILLDYQLGDGNGLDFLAALNSYPLPNKPPVIMVSAYEDADFLENCFSCGIADYIIKPVNLSLLVLKVSALIKTVAMQRLITTQNAELARFKREAEREEAIAKSTYEYLLGQHSQQIAGVSIWLKSSSPFSGDIALARISPAGDLYFLLADATGHGLSAAITVMPVVSVFDAMVRKGFPIQSIAAEINKRLIHKTSHDRFVAAIMIQFQREHRSIVVWNGGMPTAYWVNDGDISEAFHSRHMALGILDAEMFDDSTITCSFRRQGHIIAYSDGLVEAADEAGNPFSSPRVATLVKTQNDNLQNLLVNELAFHTGRDDYDDDVTICMLDLQKLFM